MKETDMAEENFRKLAALFPKAVTEITNDRGEVIRAIDADALRAEISVAVVEGNQQRYEFTWPGKRKAVELADQPITKVLIPEPAKSCGREGTPGITDSGNIYIEGDNLEVLKLLRKQCNANNGLNTVVIVTHNSLIADIADTVVHVKNGKIESVITNKNPKKIEDVSW